MSTSALARYVASRTLSGEVAVDGGPVAGGSGGDLGVSDIVGVGLALIEKRMVAEDVMHRRVCCLRSPTPAAAPLREQRWICVNGPPSNQMHCQN